MLYEAAPLLAAQESITWHFRAAMTPSALRMGENRCIRLPPPDEQAVAESTRIRSNAKADCMTLERFSGSRTPSIGHFVPDIATDSSNSYLTNCRGICCRRSFADDQEPESADDLPSSVKTAESKVKLPNIDRQSCSARRWL